VGGVFRSTTGGDSRAQQHQRRDRWRGECKPSGFLENYSIFIKTNRFSIFHDFYNILHFDEFYKTRCFEYLNYILIKKILKSTLFIKTGQFLSKFQSMYQQRGATRAEFFFSRAFVWANSLQGYRGATHWCAWVVVPLGQRGSRQRGVDFYVSQIYTIDVWSSDIWSRIGGNASR
jgi:hypothetical protein